MPSRLIFAVCVVGTIFFYKQYKNRPKVSSIVFTQLKPNTAATTDALADCKKSQYCLVTYVAPWCPACHAYLSESRSHVESALEMKKYKSVIIVGADETQNVNQLVEQIGVTAYGDVGDQFLKVNKIDFFPTHIVLQNGQMKYYGQKSYDWINSDLLKP